MRLTVRNKLLFVAALAMLTLRALTPDGYMPGSKGSGLWFELCPSGLPEEIKQALAGDSHHHHGRGGGDDSGSVSASEQCPIGHMLASAVAVDTGAPSEFARDAQLFDDTPVVVNFRSSPPVYRSRAPPA